MNYNITYKIENVFFLENRVVIYSQTKRHYSTTNSLMCLVYRLQQHSLLKVIFVFDGYANVYS